LLLRSLTARPLPTYRVGSLQGGQCALLAGSKAACERATAHETAITWGCTSGKWRVGCPASLQLSRRARALGLGRAGLPPRVACCQQFAESVRCNYCPKLLQEPSRPMGPKGNGAIVRLGGRRSGHGGRQHPLARQVLNPNANTCRSLSLTSFCIPVRHTTPVPACLRTFQISSTLGLSCATRCALRSSLSGAKHRPT
jgi:hypothetical protein